MRVTENRFVVLLPDELDDFLADYSEREMQSKGATVRQALGLLRAKARREATTEADVFAQREAA